MKGRIRWDRTALATVETATVDGLADAAEFLLEQANRTVPIEEGVLQASGGVDVDRAARQASVYYDRPYAVRQHEDTRLRHDPGRRAKWLERTLEEERSTLLKTIGARIRRVAR